MIISSSWEEVYLISKLSNIGSNQYPTFDSLVKQGTSRMTESTILSLE